MYIYFNLDVPDTSLEEIELADTDQCVVEYGDEEDPFMFEVKTIEIRNAKCEFCNLRKLLKNSCACKDVWYCSEMCLERDKNHHIRNCKERMKVEEGLLTDNPRSKKGLVGLQNIGNTCFMNTALQCISNCYELTKYFLNDYYKKDINTDNPIGSGGLLVRSYAALLNNLWYGDSSVFSPWNFKKAISNFQSMFSGYQQHDTQEFLTYVLDGLHEDLNRVLKKPMVEKDDTQKEDSIKSKEQWIGFLKRNQSYLVDIFYGQFKSTLYCPNTECQNVSTTFDPFLSMSLPLVAKTEAYEVISFFIYYDTEVTPVQLNLQFSTETSIMALRNKISKILNIHPFSFIVVKMDSQGNYEHIVPSAALLKINNIFSCRDQKPFFLFEIDPKLFYSNANKYHDEDHLWKLDHSELEEYLKEHQEENNKLFQEDYEENEEGKTDDSICYYSKFTFESIQGKRIETVRINTDNNYGFDNNWIKVVLYLKKYEDYNSRYNYRNRIIFPRIIYLNKDWTSEKIHHLIFKYFAHIIRTKTKCQLTNEDLWEKYFGDLNTNENNDTPEFHKKNLYPYRLRMKNILQTRPGNCVWCDKPNCDDCLLPYNGTTIRELLDKIPTNHDLEIDNTYLFLNDRQKGANKLWNRDFQLELVWLNDYADTVNKLLNDKRDFNFKIHSAGGSNSVCIYDCFKNFIKLEKLDESNEWFCTECKKHQKATKKMEIYHAPHILIIHLKRFTSNRKIDVLVDFPINDLDISNYVINNDDNLPLTYDLFAISNHYGSMGFGHYTAFAKNPLDGNWYEFDDSRVSKRSEKDLVSCNAFVLFYKRKGLEKLIDIKQLSDKTFIDYTKEDDNNMDVDK
jgi:ubiquitin carboxyl-terminal hydrolase 4/11/15